MSPVDCTLNPLVVGSIPTRPTTATEGLAFLSAGPSAFHLARIIALPKDGAEPPHSGARMKEDVLQCLKKYGQRLDLEIAAEMRLPLATVRSRLAELSATGAVVMSSLTRYDGDRTIEVRQCRLATFSRSSGSWRAAPRARSAAGRAGSARHTPRAS